MSSLELAEEAEEAGLVHLAVGLNLGEEQHLGPWEEEVVGARRWR